MSLRQVSTAPSKSGGQGYIRCDCKKNCNTKKCNCKNGEYFVTVNATIVYRVVINKTMYIKNYFKNYILKN